MVAQIRDLIGVDIPLVGFSHQRDVVAAVSKAGGLGVLGAVRYTPEQLDVELKWIDEHVDGMPYGVDVLLPGKLADAPSVGDRHAALVAQISDEHMAFVRDLLMRYGVIRSPEEFQLRPDAADQYTAENVEGLLDVAFSHPIRLVANALGVATPELIERAKRETVPVAALVGKIDHARKQVAAGADIIVAQGHEAGGHAGPVTTMVLLPQVVDAVAPKPVLAAGGIASGRQMAAAMALGAQGVWTGSMWLCTEEGETDSVVKKKFLTADSADAVQSRVRTGKPARQLRSKWHEEWDAPGSPGHLPMPLMEMVSFSAFDLISKAAEAGNPGAQELDSYFVGQVVGSMHEVRSVRAVVYDMVEEFVSAVESLHESAERR